MKNISLIHGTELITVSGASLLKAQERMSACQECSASVSRSFGSLLVELLGATSPVVEYVLCSPAYCPNCAAVVLEDTLVRCDGECDGEMATSLPELGTCWETTNVVLVNEATINAAQNAITGCEQCTPHAEITFDYILDAVTNCDPTVTEYVLCRAARCPSCSREVREKTFVVAH